MIYVMRFSEFSEVKAYNIYFLRELIRSMCGTCYNDYNGSEKLKKMISKQFSKDENRIISIPNGPSPLINSEENKFTKILLKTIFFIQLNFGNIKII